MKILSCDYYGCRSMHAVNTITGEGSELHFCFKHSPLRNLHDTGEGWLPYEEFVAVMEALVPRIIAHIQANAGEGVLVEALSIAVALGVDSRMVLECLAFSEVLSRYSGVGSRCVVLQTKQRRC